MVSFLLSQEPVVNARFNPSATRPLHIGHAYIAILNEHVAHDSGGNFHVRFADLPVPKLQLSREVAREIADRQLDDLRWLGLKIDDYSYETDIEPRMLKFLAKSPFRMVVDNSHYEYYSGSQATIHAYPEIYSFPVSVQHTVGKVIYDSWEGSNAMVRGFEWIQEQWLYMYLCALFGFPYPRMYYIPRLLIASDKTGSMQIDHISKTIGNWRIPDLRAAGVEPGQIHLELRESCLIDPEGPWNFDNLKRGSPRLVSRSIEDVLRR